MITGNTVPIGKILVNGQGNVNFGNAGTIVLSGDNASPNIGISVTSTGNATFNGNVVVNAPQMRVEATGAGNLSFGGGGLDLNGNYLKGAGNIAQGSLGSAVAGATYEVVSGTQTVQFDSVTGVNVNMVVNGGVVTADGTTDSNLVVSGGTYQSGGTYKNVVSSSGLLDMSDGSTLSTTSFTQTAGGNVAMSVASDFSSSQVNGNFELGGALELDASSLGSNLYGLGTVWGLFSGVNYTAGSPSPLNGSSNFSVFAMSNASSSSPYYGTFTRFGQEWYSPIATDGTYLVFQAQTGNLVVVPEPSTMVFAGLGVAMSGWTMWKKRRLSKLLAAKAG